MLLAGRLLGRLVVVVAEPDAGDQSRGVADEPGVAEILRLVPVLPAAGQPAIAADCAGAGRHRLASASRSSSPT